MKRKHRDRRSPAADRNVRKHPEHAEFAVRNVIGRADGERSGGTEYIGRYAVGLAVRQLVKMAVEDGGFSGRKEFYEFPPAAKSRLRQGDVIEREDVLRALGRSQVFLQPRQLLLHEIGREQEIGHEHRRGRVEHHEMAAAVIETVISLPAHAVSRNPHFLHHRVADVVIAGTVIERRIQFFDLRVELVPHGRQFVGIRDVALDAVSHAHDEIRLEKVDLLDRFLPLARDGAARVVAHHDEPERIRVVRGRTLPLGQIAFAAHTGHGP